MIVEQNQGLITSKLGIIINKARVKKRMTLKEVSKQVGIGCAELSELEHGERQLSSPIDDGILLRLADCLEIDIKMLKELIETKGD